ncbi:hypothetical protein GCM10010523_06640 [Paenarthrobacter ilicis]
MKMHALTSLARTYIKETWTHHGQRPAIVPAVDKVRASPPVTPRLSMVRPGQGGQPGNLPVLGLQLVPEIIQDLVNLIHPVAP